MKINGEREQTKSKLERERERRGNNFQIGEGGCQDCDDRMDSAPLQCFPPVSFSVCILWAHVELTLMIGTVHHVDLIETKVHKKITFIEYVLMHEQNTFIY